MCIMCIPQRYRDASSFPRDDSNFFKKKNESLWGWGGNVSGIFPHTLLSLKVKLLKPSLLIMQEIHKSMSLSVKALFKIALLCSAAYSSKSSLNSKTLLFF